LDKWGVIIATTTSNIYGYFAFPDITYAPIAHGVAVTYERTGLPASMFITAVKLGTPFSSDTGGLFAAPTGAYYNVGTRRVNAAGDTSSTEGNVATAWHGLTKGFLAMEAENVASHHKVLGSPNAYDTIKFKFNASISGPFGECDSVGTFGPSDSRLPVLHALAGAILHFRTVGCDGVFPRFPQMLTTLASANSQSEAVAFGYSISQLIVLLSRFDPQVAAIADVKAGTGISCFVDHFGATDLFINSNSAAWIENNTLALWELLDADTSNSDDGVSDDVDTNLAAILLALYNNSIEPGTANWSYGEFTSTNTLLSCTFNEDCASGESCMGPFKTCHSGDTCGGNLGDLAHHLSAVFTTYSIPGNIANTLKSSKCMYGNPDITYQFNGSFRDD
jgi:hypothetical protein